MAVVQVRHALSLTMGTPPPDLVREPKFLCHSCRCDSDKSTTSDYELSLRSPIVQTDEQSLKLLSAHSQNQLRWDRAMCRELGLPEGYHRISVLMVKWKDCQFQDDTTREVTLSCLEIFAIQNLMFLGD